MNMRISIMDFLRITKKKLVVTIAFPFAAILILLFGFVCDEVLGLSPGIITNAIYSFANYLYHFIFLPLTFVDIDLSPSIIFKIALILTFIWWYFLSCLSIFLLEKGWGK